MKSYCLYLEEFNFYVEFFLLIVTKIILLIYILQKINGNVIQI